MSRRKTNWINPYAKSAYGKGKKYASFAGCAGRPLGMTEEEWQQRIKDHQKRVAKEEAMEKKKKLG